MNGQFNNNGNGGNKLPPIKPVGLPPIAPMNPQQNVQNIPNVGTGAVRQPMANMQANAAPMVQAQQPVNGAKPKKKGFMIAMSALGVVILGALICLIMVMCTGDDKGKKGNLDDDDTFIVYYDNETMYVYRPGESREISIGIEKQSLGADYIDPDLSYYEVDGEKWYDRPVDEIWEVSEWNADSEEVDWKESVIVSKTRADELLKQNEKASEELPEEQTEEVSEEQVIYRQYESVYVLMTEEDGRQSKAIKTRVEYEAYVSSESTEFPQYEAITKEYFDKTDSEVVTVESCAYCGGEHKTAEHVCKKCGKTGHRETSHCSICDSLAHTAEGHKCEQCEEIGHGKETCTAKKCAECGSYVPHTHEKKQEPKKEQPKKEEPKKEESKKEETVKEEPKKEEPKREEPKKEEPKPTEKCTTCGNDKHEGDCCSICKKTGHNDAGHKCTKCGKTGHDKSDCKAVKCEFCKTYDHVTSEHPCSTCKIKGHDKERHCDICGTLNHKTDGHLCTKCGKTGHDAATCTAKVEKDKCTICQSTEHKASVHCGNCKEIGHTAAKCTKKECAYCGWNEDHETKGHKCTKCEKTGHDAKDCQAVACEFCGKYDHTTANHGCTDCGGTGHQGKCCKYCKTTAHTTAKHKCSRCGKTGHDKPDCKAVACDFCGSYDHATTKHVCSDCGVTGHEGNCCKYCKTTAHTTKEHECSQCKQKGHDVNDNKCIFCSLCRDYGDHEKTGHVCTDCDGTGHQGNCCKYCKTTAHTTAKHVCSDCKKEGHQGGCQTAPSSPTTGNEESAEKTPAADGDDTETGSGGQSTTVDSSKPVDETLFCQRCMDVGHDTTETSVCPNYCEICAEYAKDAKHGHRKEKHECENCGSKTHATQACPKCEICVLLGAKPYGHSTSEHPCSGGCSKKGVDKKIDKGSTYHCSEPHDTKVTSGN